MTSQASTLRGMTLYRRFRLAPLNGHVRPFMSTSASEKPLDLATPHRGFRFRLSRTEQTPDILADWMERSSDQAGSQGVAAAK
jgi:hypothetical protein